MAKLKTVAVLMFPCVVYRDHLDAIDGFSPAHLIISDLAPEAGFARYMVQSKGLRQQGSYSGGFNTGVQSGSNGGSNGKRSSLRNGTWGRRKGNVPGKTCP